MTGAYVTSTNVDPDATARFYAKVEERTSGCHEWTAHKTRGYGRFKLNGRMWLAHRVAYILANGEIPDGLELDHLCRNRSCVNPAHLEPVTKLENQLRSPISIIADCASRTRCPQGHDNYTLRCDGARICRTCIADRQRARRAAKRVAR